MNTAIIVPGRPDKDEYYEPQYPSNSNSHWYPWLSKQLMLRDIFAVALEIPRPWQPRYAIWKKELERFDIDEHTALIGHSCGGGFLVRWLSENKDRRVGKVVLVAPWMNPGNNPVSDTADFFDFAIDPEIASRTQGITICNSDNDMASVQQTVKNIREHVTGVTYKEFHLGHFTFEDMGTDAFPELRDLIV
jgi:predicted alpha/beta hydrolase family esterase